MEETFKSYYYIYENDDGESVEAVDLGAVEAVKEAMKAGLEKENKDSAVKVGSATRFRAGLDRGGMHKRVMGPDGVMQDA